MSEDVKAYGAGDERDSNAAARLNQLRALTEGLGWSQRRTARELEVDERTARYWFSGQYPTPITVVYALRYLQLIGAGEPRADQAATGAQRADPIGGDGHLNHLVQKTFGTSPDKCIGNALAHETNAIPREGVNALAPKEREVFGNALASKPHENALRHGPSVSDDTQETKGNR